MILLVVMRRISCSTATPSPPRKSRDIGDVERNGNPQTVPPRPGRSRGWVARQLEEEIDLKHSDLIIFVCYFLSGLCDSSAHATWSCFVSMQTGKAATLLSLLFVNLVPRQAPISSPGMASGAAERGRERERISQFACGADDYSYKEILSFSVSR